MKTQELKDLADYLHGSIPRISFYPQVDAEYQGLKFSLFIIPETKGSPETLKIVLFKSSFFKLRILRKVFCSCFLEKLFGMPELKVNDELFDKALLIQSNDSFQTLNFLGDLDRKNAIKELFNSKVNSLEIDGKKITIKKPNYDEDRNLESQNITKVFQQLALLAQGLKAP